MSSSPRYQIPRIPFRDESGGKNFVKEEGEIGIVDGWIHFWGNCGQFGGRDLRIGYGRCCCWAGSKGETDQRQDEVEAKEEKLAVKAKFDERVPFGVQQIDQDSVHQFQMLIFFLYMCVCKIFRMDINRN